MHLHEGIECERKESIGVKGRKSRIFVVFLESIGSESWMEREARHPSCLLYIDRPRSILRRGGKVHKQSHCGGVGAFPPVEEPWCLCARVSWYVGELTIVLDFEA